MQRRLLLCVAVLACGILTSLAQSPPDLLIDLSTDSKVSLSWPETPGNIVLEETDTLTLWRPFPQPPTLLNGQFSVLADIAGDARFFRLHETGGLPPDPASVAQPPPQGVATLLAEATEFLYTGTNRIQTGVAPGTIDARRAAVVRGKVKKRDDTPLSGVTISILNHPEFGQTLSRADGRFDMAVNGGGFLTLKYEKTDFCPVQRQINVPWQDYITVADVVMIQMDPLVTPIALGIDSPMQVHQGSMQTDADGARKATLLFTPGTCGSLLLPDGTTQECSSISVRATEFTVGTNGPATMPAILPPNSGYTYCVELSADEAVAQGATSVQFDRPVFTYVENFIGFPVGMVVPVGFYDRQKAAWVPSPNGRVIKVLSVTAGIADVDTDGDGNADSGEGITDGERQQLATLYAAGQSLWRVPVTHFTPWDCNWPYGLPDDATTPDGEVENDQTLDDSCEAEGSIIECENQVLGDSGPIVGTPYSLNYRSSRVPGRVANRTLNVKLSGSTVPASLQSIELHLTVAGQTLKQTFPAAPNQQTTFVWDGLDAYGRPVHGGQLAVGSIDYIYPAVYREPGEFGAAFAQFGAAVIAGNRQTSTITLSLPISEVLGEGYANARTIGLGGWTLSGHHFYDPVARVLHTGDGRRRSANLMSSIITTVAGNGIPGFSGDNGPATQASLHIPGGITVGPDGSLYIADLHNHRIRRVGPDGIITTVAGGGSSLGDGGPATQASLSNPIGVAVGPDGSLYIADQNNHRIRRVGPDGIINTVAGTGTPGFSGDGGPATKAQFSDVSGVAVGPDRGLYIVDSGHHRIRRVAPPLPGLSAGDIAIVSEDGGLLYVFNSAGRHLRTLDALTGATLFEFGYDADGRLTQVTEKTGGTDNLTTILHDGAGNPTAIVGPFGQQTTLAVDANGFLASIANPAGEEMQFTSTADGLLTNYTDPRGKTSVYTYDADGRLIHNADPADGSQTLARVAITNGFTVTRTTALNRVTTYQTENLPGNIQRRTITAPDGSQSESTEIIDAGTTHVTSSDGMISDTILGPDPRFGMQSPVTARFSLQFPSTLQFTVSSTRAADLTDAADPLSLVSQTNTITVGGRTATNIYTAATRTAVNTTPAGRTQTVTLDALGRFVQGQIGNLDPVLVSFDTRSRLQSISNGTRSVSLNYNAQGFLDTITDSIGRTAHLGYDVAGRVTTKTLSDGRVVSLGYDAAGNLTSLTPPGRPAHTFGYSDRNELTLVNPPAVPGTGPTTYSYDADRALTRITRPGGQTITIGYDSEGRPATRELATSGGPTTTDTLSYDSAGRITNIIAASGASISYTYDGILASGEIWSGPVTGSVTRNYDNGLRVANQSVNGANTIAFSYDNDSLLTAAGDLEIVRNLQNGLPTSTILGVVSSSVAYNSFGDVTDYSASAGGSPLYTKSVSRDALGRITQKIETIAGVTDTYTYTYDLTSQLTGVARNGTTIESYAYDPTGNRTNATISGTSASAIYDDQDRVTQYGGTTFTYTPAGDLQSKTAAGQTTTYEYDALGNLLGVTLPNATAITYVIDGRGRRVGKIVNGTFVNGIIYGDRLRPVAELDGSGVLVSQFVYAGRNVPVYMIKGGVAHRIITDQVGSVRLVVNSVTGAIVQRMDYDSFGNVILDTNPGFQPFGFAGGIYDPDTGLVRFGARDYDSSIGRWTAKDPIGFGGDDFNLYRYVRNNPVNFVDPIGMAIQQQTLLEQLLEGLAKIEGRILRERNRVPEAQSTADELLADRLRETIRQYTRGGIHKGTEEMLAKLSKSCKAFGGPILGHLEVIKLGIESIATGEEVTFEAVTEAYLGYPVDFTPGTPGML